MGLVQGRTRPTLSVEPRQRPNLLAGTEQYTSCSRSTSSCAAAIPWRWILEDRLRHRRTPATVDGMCLLGHDSTAPVLMSVRETEIARMWPWVRCQPLRGRLTETSVCRDGRVEVSTSDRLRLHLRCPTSWVRARRLTARSNPLFCPGSLPCHHRHQVARIRILAWSANRRLAAMATQHEAKADEEQGHPKQLTELLAA